MRKTSLLILATLASVASLRAEDDKPAPSAPPENLYFNTDEFIYIPKFTLKLGFRSLSGASTSFRGSGKLANYRVNAGSNITDVANRTYQDGGVGIDSRKTSSGFDAPDDGLTNNWVYYYPGQEATAGYIGFHTYEARIEDTGEIKQDNGNAYGVEVSTSKDFGKIWKVLVSLGGGLGLNDLSEGSTADVEAKITVLEDLYWLNGAKAPGTGERYSSPNYQSDTVYGPNGEVLYTNPPSNTSTQTQTNDLSTLIGSTPSDRTVTETQGFVKNTFKVKGAFMTLRLGPDFVLPITAKFRLSIGVGAALAYIGTNYKVDSSYTPDVGKDLEGNTISVDPITFTTVGYDKGYTAGYYVDANAEYWLTERTGFYAGAIYQNSGSYDQQIHDNLGKTQYSSHVDLSSLSGFRSGMTYRF